MRVLSFAVEVAGDLLAPQLEEAKVTEHRWVTPTELVALQAEADAAVFALASRGLELVANLRR